MQETANPNLTASSESTSTHQAKENPSKIRVAINGFGRIGRLTARILLNKYADQVDLVAINDITSPENLAYLWQYDSTYRKFEKQVKVENGNLIVENQVIEAFAEKEPNKLPWKRLNIDIVLECTGHFLTHELASLHLEAGCKKVILSAPAKETKNNPILTVAQGVNWPSIQSSLTSSNPNGIKSIVSNASCTTNAVAPGLKVLWDNFEIVAANALTVHAYTATQMIQDGPSRKEFRDGRAAAINMIPSKTGAAKAVELVIPELSGKLSLSSLRVPIITGSLIYLTAQIQPKDNLILNKEMVNQMFQSASEAKLKGILEYSSENLVSTDIIGNPHSAIFDSQLTEIIGNTIKVVLWYDNEWGYANRLAELCLN